MKRGDLLATFLWVGHPQAHEMEANKQIRRDEFDQILPEVMRGRKIDMWIHVVREAVPDPRAAEELGSTSGVFVFTDRVWWGREEALATESGVEYPSRRSRATSIIDEKRSGCSKTMKLCEVFCESRSEINSLSAQPRKQ